MNGNCMRNIYNQNVFLSVRTSINDQYLYARLNRNKQHVLFCDNKTSIMSAMKTKQLSFMLVGSRRRKYKKNRPQFKYF